MTAGRTLVAIQVESGRAPETLPGMAAFSEAFRPARKRLVGGDGIDLGTFSMHAGPEETVRDRVVRVGHADLGVGAAGQLATEHEGGDPRQVGLPGQGEQVEHQPGRRRRPAVLSNLRRA